MLTPLASAHTCSFPGPTPHLPTSQLKQPGALHLVLRPFDAEQSSAFVSAALGGAAVPPEVARLLWERSSGLPSFLEQLVVFLQLFVQTQLQAGPPAQAGIFRRAGRLPLADAMPSALSDRLQHFLARSQAPSLS